MDSPLEVDSKSRLIVIIPECLSGDTELAHKIHHMAANRHCDVFYLTLLDDEDRYMTVSRSMATLKALTADRDIIARSKLVRSPLWLKTLSELYRRGDQIVCNQEQMVETGFMKATPMADWILRRFHAAPLTISGFYNPEKAQVRYWLHHLVTWLGFIVILGAFTLLEVKVDAQGSSTAGRALFILLIAVEYGAVWAWNRVIS
jgi:hypothetical protein